MLSVVLLFANSIELANNNRSRKIFSADTQKILRPTQDDKLEAQYFAPDREVNEQTRRYNKRRIFASVREVSEQLMS